MIAVLYVAIAVVVLIVLLAVCGSLRSRRLMAPEQFADAVRRRIEENHPDIAIKEAQGFSWRLSVKGRDVPMFLDNTYLRYRQSPEAFDSLVDVLVKALSEGADTESSWEVAKPKLLPSLKSQDYLNQTRSLEGGDKLVDNLVVLSHNDELRILIAVDSEFSMFFATKDQLANWGVSPEEALNQALENLAKLTAPHWVEATERAKRHGVFAFNVQDSYDASRLLLPDFYERASRALGCTRIAVGVPNRDMVAAFPADNPANLDALRAHIRGDYEKYDHPVSPNVILLPE